MKIEEMKIWFDICHTPQFNFFKPVMKALVEKGHRIYVTVLDRGKTPKIIQHELSGWQNVTVDVVGRHRMTKWSAIVEANLLRDIQLMRWIRGKKIDIGFSNGMQLAMVCGLKGIPNYSFDDDPQTADRKWKEKWNTECNFCVYEDEAIKAPSHVLRCTKEWAYLNPRTFVPKVEVLERYGVKPKEYMFLREVSVGTINYTGQESGAILGIKDMIPKGMKVLLSLEEKKQRSEYPEEWILLQEPIEDIHSLIYYAAGLVSSGDSMAREAALLGVPAYYLGIRYTMPANAAASKVAGLQNRRTMSFEAWVKEYIEDKPKKEITKNTESTVADSNLQALASQSACEQAHRQLDNQVPATDADAHHLCDSSQKNVICDNSQKNVSSDDTSKNGHADERVRRLTEKQRELREHIDDEFIDINGYMLDLIEGKQ